MTSADAFIRNDERSVLSKGLNFAMAPSRIPVEDFVIATEKICTQLEPQKADALRSEVTFTLHKARPGIPNLSKDEREAIKRLRQDESIQVLPADKGRATVIMDKQEYESKVKAMLDDEKMYVKLDKDPTPQYKKKLVSILSRLKNEEETESQQVQGSIPDI